MIDREKLIKILESAESAIYWGSEDKNFIEKIADHLIANDVVPVVRCKDCKHWMDSWVAPDGKHEHGYCHLEDADDVIVGRWGDDFCSYGERRSDG